MAFRKKMSKGYSKRKFRNTSIPDKKNRVPGYLVRGGYRI